MMGTCFREGQSVQLEPAGLEHGGSCGREGIGQATCNSVSSLNIPLTSIHKQHSSVLTLHSPDVLHHRPLQHLSHFIASYVHVLLPPGNFPVLKDNILQLM